MVHHEGDKMQRVKLTKEQRDFFKKFGKRVRKEVEQRPDYPEILKKMTDAGVHGKKGGKPRKYAPCHPKGQRQPNPRHRFWAGKCSLCGKTPEELRRESE